jgi:hypothetical protein
MGKYMILPGFPPERQQRGGENLHNEGNVPHPTKNHERIHDCTLEEFVKVGKGGSFEYIPDGMHVLVLRVLDEPHSSGTHDLATTTEEDSKHVPIREVRVVCAEKGRKSTNINIVPTTQW